ncbi:zinc finger protein 862-like [Antedon mediterranea]|uniref:zinc finger protein 862-like n=1 Tax=Antedon mediterranea TaxID=105859 RepID=UPI003AF92C1B
MEMKCELMKKVGVDIGSRYGNRFKAREFVHALAETMRNDVKKLIERASFITIMADGSTDRTVVEQETVKVRFVSKGCPAAVLADLVPLEYAHAEGVLAAIVKGLGRLGLQMDNLADFSKPGPTAVAANFDGAAVMMGNRTGVATRIRETMPAVIPFHCVAHNLELAVLDTVKHNPAIKSFEQIIKWLYTFYSKFNAKNRRDVKAIAAVLDTEFVHLPQIKDVGIFPLNI